MPEDPIARRLVTAADILGLAELLDQFVSAEDPESVVAKAAEREERISALPRNPPKWLPVYFIPLWFCPAMILSLFASRHVAAMKDKDRIMAGQNPKHIRRRS